MTTSTTKTEYNIRKLFPAQFTITVEQKLFDFCTNEIGILLSEQLNSLSNAAVIGNPVRLIQLDSSSNLHTNKLIKGTVTALGQNCSGKYLAMSTGPSLSIFDLQKGAILREFHDHDGPIGGITWHRNSPWQLATVGADCTLRIWDLRSHPAQIALRRTSKPYRRLEYSPDCNYIGCAGQMVSIFDLNMTQSIVDMVCASPANNICFNPAECLLATSSEDRVVRFWDVDTGECVTQSPTFDAPIGQIFFESDGRFLAVNTRKQISCIHWEPFELFSQLSYPVQMKIPTLSIASLLNSSSFAQSDETYPQINLLDLCMHGEFLHQLTVVNMDPTKIGTICLASIPIQKLEKCGLNNPVAIDEGIPVCPITVFKGVRELDEVEDEKEVEGEAQVREDDISPESVTTSTTAESMLDSLTTIQNPHQSMPIPSHQFVKSPFTVTSNRKRPPVGRIIKCGASSAEIAFTEDISSITNSSEMKMRQKKQQRQSDSNSTPELKDGCSARPNRLLIIQQVQQQPNTSNSEQGSSNSSSSENRKTLIRRGNSLNNVNDITTNDNMPISSVAMANAKNRSRSQAQHNRFSKFSMSNSSTSSNASSTISTIGDNIGRRRKTLQNVNPSIDVVEEELEEFMNFDPKVRSIINKQNKEINALSASLSTIRGNITECMVEQATRYEEPHIFAQLLNDYMRKPKVYAMGLNAAFLNRVHVLIGHRNNNYVQLGIDFIDMVTTRFGDCIQHGLASQEYTIGVDVAAEQRFERCTKSKNALFQIRLNTAFNTERMDPAQRTRFNEEILPRIDNIIDSKGFKQPSASFNERANQSSFN